MARWEPDAAGRLQQAAIELYGEQGYENTTVAEIAERAGLTERTFFRHFADKREVLFGGADRMQEQLETQTATAPSELSALDAVAVALESLTGFFDDARRPISARRGEVIDSSANLRERELGKLASLVTAVAGALRERGEDETTALAAAEIGIAAFHLAFRAWLADPMGRPYDVHAREALAHLRAVCAAGRSAPLTTGR